MMDYHALEQLSRAHPGWRLLRADHAPFVIAFLHRAFIEPNVRTLSQSELVTRIEDFLHGLRAELGENAFPRAARAYLDEWASDDHGWLRKYYAQGSDEPRFDLNRAHEAVLRARLQVERLVPLVGECERHGQFTAEVEALRSARDSLHIWSADRKRALLVERTAKLGAEVERLTQRLSVLALARDDKRNERDQVKRAIAENGGDRIEQLRREIERLSAERGRRQRNADRYDGLARAAELPAAISQQLFDDNHRALEEAIEDTRRRQASSKTRRDRNARCCSPRTTWP